jgi:hypothetical protein
MIPEERVRRALLNVEKKQVIEDLNQLNAAIMHLLSGGKHNYDAARSSTDRQEDYNDTSAEILVELRTRRQNLENRLNFLLEELVLLEGQE